jgi:hypothetical protein
MGLNIVNEEEMNEENADKVRKKTGILKNE